MQLFQIYLICILVMIALCIIDLLLCAITIYQLFLKKSYILISWYFKALTTFTITIYSLCAIGDIIHVIIRYQHYLKSTQWQLSEAYLAGTIDLLFYFGNFAFFLLLIIRIKSSFQLSKHIIFYLSLLLIIFTITGIINSFFVFYFGGKSFTKWESQDQITEYILSITDFILSLSLFILFIYKLRNKDSLEGIEIADDLSLFNQGSEYDHDGRGAIKNLMVKHCVLFGIALIANQFWYIAAIIAEVTTLTNDWAIDLITFYIFRSVEVWIINIVLWLVLKVNNDKYICLCKCWHLCMLKYCMKEDPNIIREGFVVEEKEQILMSTVNEVPFMSITGRDVTARTERFDRSYTITDENTAGN